MSYSDSKSSHPLLANGFWRFREVCGSIVYVDDYGSSKQMLPVLFLPIHHTKEFLVCDAVLPLSMQ